MEVNGRPVEVEAYRSRGLEIWRYGDMTFWNSGVLEAHRRCNDVLRRVWSCGGAPLM